MALAFISHSNKDEEFAQQLKDRLAGIGFASVFLDFDKDRGIGVGAAWERRLYQEIEQSQVVIIVLTPAWLESKWCFAEFTQARALGKAIFPVIMSPVGERFFAGDIQSVDITKEGEGGFEKLGRSLTEIALNAQGGFDWDRRRPPYPGLLAFQEEDAAVFFGRDDDIRRIIERMNVRRSQGGAQLLALLAASGTGKSSLLRAGIIPRLRRDPANWFIVPIIRPGRHPLDELARALGASLGEDRDWRSIRDQLTGPEASRTLQTVAQDLQTKARAHHATVLLSFDQAEELFNMASAEEARVFLELLSVILAGDLPYLGLLVMRSDQLERLQRAAGLTSRFEELSLKPMPFERMGEIIRGPSKVAGLEIEEQLVSAAMRDAATSDALPLLAFTLRELYERHAASGRLTLANYEGLGAVGLTPLENAVRHAADETLAAARPTDDELEALRRAFVPGMARVNEVGEYSRRIQAWKDLPPQSVRLIEALVTARLLVVRGKGSEQQVEVAHEALLRKWPRLTAWLDLERDLIIGKHQIEGALADWNTAPPDQKKEALLQGLLLTRARQWLSRHRYALSAEEQEFIEASARSADEQAHRQRVLRRVLTWGSVASAVTFAALSALAGWQWQASEKNRSRSYHNFGLALLTQAETDLRQEKPAHAFVAASVATGFSPAQGEPQAASLDPTSNAYLRAKTIANITAASAQFPDAVVGYLPGGVHAVAMTAQGDLLAFAGQNLEVSLVPRDALHPIARLVGHNNRINSVKFSPDGQLIATGSSDRTIGLWDIKGRKVASLCGHGGPIQEVSFHPGGKLLASAGRDRTVRIWDVATHNPTQVFNDVEGWAQSVKFSRDGTLLAYSDQKGSVTIRESQTWNVLKAIRTTDGDLVSVAISPDGGMLATASFDGSMRVFSLPDGRQLGVLAGPKDRLWKIAFMPDGKRIASASWDGSVRLWDSATFEQSGTFDAHDHWVNDMSFAAEQPLMATASEDGYVRLWQTNRVVPTFATTSDHAQEALRATFSRDGRLFVSSSTDKTAFVYQVDDKGVARKVCGPIVHSDWVWGLALTSDGKVLVTAGTIPGGTDNVIRLSSTETCAALREIHVGTLNITSLKLSPDDRLIAATSTDGSIRIFNANDGSPKLVLQGHSGPVFDADFDPSGEFLASAGKDRHVIVWRTRDGQIFLLLQGHEGPVWRVRFSPDGKLLASGGGESRVLLWDWRAAQPTRRAIPTPTTLANLLFAADGSTLAIGDDSRGIAIWDTRSWQRVSELSAMVGVRGPLAFHPLHRLLAFDGENGVVRFWDLDRGGHETGPRIDVTLEGTKISFKQRLKPNADQQETDGIEPPARLTVCN